jgi:hypothetical protein
MTTHKLLPKVFQEGKKWVWTIHLNSPTYFLCSGAHATKKLAEEELEKELEQYRRYYSISQQVV